MIREHLKLYPCSGTLILDPRAVRVEDITCSKFPKIWLNEIRHRLTKLQTAFSSVVVQRQALGDMHVHERDTEFISGSETYRVNIFLVVVSRERLSYCAKPYLPVFVIRQLEKHLIPVLQSIIVERPQYYTERLLRYRRFICTYLLLTRIDMDLEQELISDLSTYLVLRSCGLKYLIPPLLDARVEDLFARSSSNYVYLAHSIGANLAYRVRNVVSELRALLRLAKLKGLALDEERPSGKCDIKLFNHSLRLVFDTHPYTPNTMSINIRKLDRSYFSLTRLIQYGCLSVKDAAYLLTTLLLKRESIMIVGEVSTGKTTLLNALDLALPHNLRRVYIEEAEETPRVPYLNQVKYIVEPYEVSAKARYLEVIKLLHKRPDIVIFGEAKGYLHFKALYHAVITGIRCLATAHAPSVSALLMRLLNIYKIPPEVITQVPVVVVMCREGTVRKVRGIYRLIQKGSEVLPINYDIVLESEDSEYLKYMDLIATALEHALIRHVLSPTLLSFYLDEFYRRCGLYEVPR